ncbi:hypothetical protein [Hydrogenimonas sp.]
MEVVGYECYANGTVKPVVMPLRDDREEFPKKELEYYGAQLCAQKRAQPGRPKKSGRSEKNHRNE